VKRTHSRLLLPLLIGLIPAAQAALAVPQTAKPVARDEVRTHDELGNSYLAQKQFDLAEKEFRTALQLEPGNADANYNLGVLLLAKGAAGEAVTHLERVRPPTTASQFSLIRAYLEGRRNSDALHLAAELSAQNKADVKVHFSLGVLLASQKQYRAGEVELEKAQALQPNTFAIAYNLGLAYLRDGVYAQAQAALDRALKLNPDSPEALSLQAQVLAIESRPMDALALLVRAHKMVPENTDVILLMAQISMSQHYFEDAIPLLESGIVIAPQRIDLHAALGESYLMADRNDKAIVEIEKVLAVAPSARSYALLGLSYQRLGRFEEAKQAFAAGLKLDAHNASCLFHLGFIAERQGDAAEAQARFEAALHTNPGYADALLELANLRIAAKSFPQAEELLKKYVQVSSNPAPGYYKLAMVERNLHDKAATERYLGLFQTYARQAQGGAFPNEHLFDYLDTRARLAPGARNELDIADLTSQLKDHPDQPQGLYLLAEAYLKAGNTEEAKNTIAQLDKVSAGDYHTQTGLGVLLARYHLYDQAIEHFQAALRANAGSDEIKFDLADAFFRKGQYQQALGTAETVSDNGRKDDAYLSLLGDIYGHLGDTARATEIFHDAILRNPDNDQNYLSLALLELRNQDLPAARKTLLEGQARIPGSGKILWGLGLTSALEGNAADAGGQLERAVDMLPEWPGSYSTLGVFYFQTGQIAKAKEVLGRFRNTDEHGVLDIGRIESVLEQAPEPSPAELHPMNVTSKQQLLQLALTLADRTL
jgi:tetratricopeptide (TPR) repeat protein